VRKKYFLTQHAQGNNHKANMNKNQILNRLYRHSSIQIENPSLKYILEKYSNQFIPSESTLRKDYLESTYNENVAAIREHNGDRCICLFADETTDALGGYTAHLTVGNLVPDKPSNPRLSCLKSLEKVNSQSVVHFIEKGLNILYPSGVDDTKILLFLCTDATTYMLAASPVTNMFIHI
jgi:hypothetical protein